MPADLGLVGPAQNGIAGHLRAVVADDSDAVQPLVIYDEAFAAQAEPLLTSATSRVDIFDVPQVNYNSARCFCSTDAQLPYSLSAASRLAGMQTVSVDAMCGSVQDANTFVG